MIKLLLELGAVPTDLHLEHATFLVEELNKKKYENIRTMLKNAMQQKGMLFLSIKGCLIVVE